MAKKKHNPIDVQFDEKGMRNFDNVNDAIAHFGNPEHGGHAIQNIISLFNSTFVIRVGNVSINVSGWKSPSFEKTIESVFKLPQQWAKFQSDFADWKLKFEDQKPQIIEEQKHDEPIVDESENTIVD